MTSGPRGRQSNHRARRLCPLAGRQGAHRSCVRCAGEEHPVDTIAGARKLAGKEEAT
jgi:hypothetical protein